MEGKKTRPASLKGCCLKRKISMDPPPMPDIRLLEAPPFVKFSGARFPRTKSMSGPTREASMSGEPK